MSKIFNLDIRLALKKIPNRIINTSITSPPYWGLRDYGEETTAIWGGDEKCEHEWGKKKKTLSHKSGETNPGKEGWYKDKGASNDKGHSFCSKCGAWKGQLGLEPTPELYIKHLCDIYDLIYPKIRDDGTIWINIGDTYGGSGGASGHTEETKNLGYTTSKMGAVSSGSKTYQSKCLVMIPFRFAIEMVNRGWILRNTIIWHKGNPMPCPIKDRFTVDFEYLFFFSKNRKYYFEQQFESYKEPINRWGGEKLKAEGKSTWDEETGQGQYRDRDMRPNPQGRNKRTTWKINTKPFPGAHFAVYPEELVDTPIKSCCPQYICTQCGKPKVLSINKEKVGSSLDRGAHRVGNGKVKGGVYNIPHKSARIKIGDYEPTCNCNKDFRPGVVLDPFMGAGTTGVVSRKLGRYFIGVEISERFTKMAKNRLKDIYYKKRLF